MGDCVSSELVRRQKENEVDIITGGVLRYRERTQKAEQAGRASENKPNTWMMQRFIKPASEWIQGQVDAALQGKAGVGAAGWVRVLDRLDADVCAFIGLKMVQNTVFSGLQQTRTAIAEQIGRAVQEELQFNHMRAEDCRTYKYWTKQAEIAVDRKTKQRCLIKLKKNPDVSLKETRKAMEEAKQRLAEGVDPNEYKRAMHYDIHTL